ncbi:MAG: bifunctional riboflavin kinase/FAD synthetase [Ignavibacteriales bacterium]|nr:MAG: bifunctional riboflavin kinase/FAD synthetase [Ignavibacteriales bacterium]
MKVFNNIEQISKDVNTVLTIGTFDGFHIGHQEIIRSVVETAGKQNSRSFVITFEPHPRSVVSKDYDVKLLTTINEKLELFEKAGIENVLIIDFTMEFSKLTAEEFVSRYLVNKIGINSIILGHDHKLGKDRAGGEDKIKELGAKYNFNVVPVSAVQIDGEIVSSTKVRNALLNSELDKANKFLGRDYSINGKIVEGAKRGRTLGFPTANINPDNPNKIIPSNGIYFVECFIRKQKYFGLLNIGTRPTFDDSAKVILEVYLYDFAGDIYGEDISVILLKRMRDELKYNTKEELIAQMENDKQNGIELIKNINN